jgi:hypothetical protein
LEKNIDETLKTMVQIDVLSVETEAGEPGQAYVEEDFQLVSLSAEQRRIGREHFDYYCFLLWPVNPNSILFHSLSRRIG